jgi:hypothetical protein
MLWRYLCDNIVLLEGIILLCELMFLGQPASMTIKIVDLTSELGRNNMCLNHISGMSILHECSNLQKCRMP